jgi:hypothetical protein
LVGSCRTGCVGMVPARWDGFVLSDGVVVVYVHSVLRRYPPDACFASVSRKRCGWCFPRGSFVVDFSLQFFFPGTGRKPIASVRGARSMDTVSRPLVKQRVALLRWFPLMIYCKARPDTCKRAYGVRACWGLHVLHSVCKGDADQHGTARWVRQNRGSPLLVSAS